jgi:hypothetical protein
MKRRSEEKEESEGGVRMRMRMRVNSLMEGMRDGCRKVTEVIVQHNWAVGVKRQRGWDSGLGYVIRKLRY